MTRLGPYAKYKDSGVEWFPRIPVTWSATKLKHISERLPGGTPDTSIDDYWRTDGSGSPWVSIGDMSGRRIISTTAKSLTKEALASKPLPVGKPGTLLFAMYASVGEVTPLGIQASWNQALLGIEARSIADSRFLYYALQSIRDWLPALYRSNTQNNLNADQVGNFDIPLPPIEVQKSISEYLDGQTAQIDELIGKQERLIELLAEKRQAIITQAVTKGLDPNAPTKPSGVPWQGPVPEHWTVQPLKNLIRMQTGVTLGKDFSEMETETYPYLRVANVQIGYVDLNEVKEIDLPKEVAATSMLRAGDVLMTEGGDRDKLARGCIWEAPIAPCVHQNHIFAVRTGNQLLNEFLVLVLDADPARSYFYLTGKQSTNLASTNSTTVKNYRFGVPPMDEQQRIVHHLRRKTRLIDDLVDKANAVISTLKERRSALISAAVTGKIDVQGAA
ncbi:hypothetical protein ANMWB30_11780 [Arthrobacter sp. MWB30]|nr:hypothetical protein ANMWB30_11780 [Arthrobacter sp. MWB30]